MDIINEIATSPNVASHTIFYRELKTEDDFSQCIYLQKAVFGLPDSHLISPLILKLYSRKNPNTGLAIGAFKKRDNKNELIGIIIGAATTHQHTNYIMLLGVSDEYKNKTVGYKLLQKFRELSLLNNIRYTYGVYEPLESNLARLYFKIGFRGVQYNLEPSTELAIPSDKLLIKWDFLNSISYKMGTKFHEIPIIKPGITSDNPNVLIEIPDNYSLLQSENPQIAKDWRNNTRILFDYYVNQKKYIVTDCITQMVNNKRKSFYLLELL